MHINLIPKKLKKVLQSANQTPYYHNLFEKFKINIDEIKTYEDFKKIPITTKEDYKNNQFDFITSSILKKMDVNYLKKITGNYKLLDEYLGQFGLNLVITSGSTGIPIEVIHSKQDDIRNYFALNLYRKNIKNFDINSKYLWILPMNRKTKSMFYNESTSYLLDGTSGIQYFLADYNKESIKKMHEIIVRNSVRWITGSPSAIVEYAKYLQDENLKYSFDYIELHSEPCLEWQKRLIESVFNIIPKCIYSSNEINFIAATCTNNNYHILDDNVFVELIDNNYKNKNDKKVIITGLNYYDTPLIRYDISDIAELTECTDCNMKMKPAIILKGFRDSDMIVHENGDLSEPYIIYDSVFFLEKKFKFEMGYYQAKQVAYKNFTFCFENYNNWSEKIKNAIKNYLENFISEALGYRIIVTLDLYDRSKEYSEKFKGKYKRFESNVNKIE